MHLARYPGYCTHVASFGRKSDRVNCVKTIFAETFIELKNNRDHDASR